MFDWLLPRRNDLEASYNQGYPNAKQNEKRFLNHLFIFILINCRLCLFFVRNFLLDIVNYILFGRSRRKKKFVFNTMDTTQIDIKTLEEAVTVFYRSNSQLQSAAHDWLTKAQLSPNAWSFVWELMQIEKVTKNPSFFYINDE